MLQPLIMDHPMVQHKLSILRNSETGPKEFRELINEITTLMGYEATRDMPLEEVEIDTPMGKAKVKTAAGRKYAFVPILRAGLGMVDGMLNLVPVAKIGHIGMYRDPETHQPIEYYCKLPFDVNEREVIVLDPMLATGGSAVDAIRVIKNYGVKRIKFMCIIAAPEGLAVLQEQFPDVQVYCAALDDHLNENKYIIPGLGDAGDRIFGTK